MVIGQLSAQGINVEMPTLPDLEEIGPHILPRVDSMRRTSEGLETDSFSTMPISAINSQSPATAGILVALLLPAVQQAREAARRNQTMNKMKQIEIALQNYHDVHKHFPPAATTDKDGKPLLSWRVAILPYMDENPLYQQFHLDEPWDSEHNLPLSAKLPDSYESPSFSTGNKTLFLGALGKELMFTGAEGLGMRSVIDGTSKTIMFVEADPAKAVVWSQPGDLKIDPKQPDADLATHAGGVHLVAAVDGSIHTLSTGVKAATLWALFTRAGREPDPWPDN
jgi:type II secretory pathway pseudopilin PulG